MEVLAVWTLADIEAWTMLALTAVVLAGLSKLAVQSKDAGSVLAVMALTELSLVMLTARHSGPWVRLVRLTLRLSWPFVRLVMLTARLSWPSCSKSIERIGT